MILDLAALQPGAAELDRPDAIAVVGSGAAGLAVALRLEELGRPVVLVESGGDPRDGEAVAAAAPLNGGEVVGQQYRGLTDGRQRSLGGATQLWHGQCTRLRDGDLSPRPWLPHSGWPLDLADLDPWYEAAERWFELSGRGYDRGRWTEHRRLSPLPWTADRLLDDFAEYTPMPHLGDRFRQHLRTSTTVQTLVSATAVGVRVEGDRVRGVELRDPSGRELFLTVGTVVLAAGAVESARLLMLSDPEGVGLGAGRELTGRYLQDHPVAALLEVVPTRRAWLQDRTSHLFARDSRIWPKVRLAPAAQEREELVAANAVLVHEVDEPELDAVRRLAGALRRRRLPDDLGTDLRLAVRAVLPTVRTGWRRWVRGLASGRPASRVRLDVWLEQVPDPESRVTLDADRRDAFGFPSPRVDWRVSETEVRTSRTMARWVAEDLRTHGLAEVTELPAMTDDEAWRASVADAFHPAGTTRMSTDPTTGVVDPDLRVHGVDGLYVASSSVFPIAGYANPTLTIVALALRLAEHLVRQREVSDHPA
ncbi:Choline dehydrogenase [Klenkia marina]|uniref:Choline dehydrogenase n=1 Tax=Klenkia marina TaxID=1960309 RepID=A0A1G4XFT3_9ACTN|nr:GMC family oxidoreductase [Klenkia marina]SCX40083.1 Choline dehydrogenase [Klenkia marina]